MSESKLVREEHYEREDLTVRYYRGVDFVPLDDPEEWKRIANRPIIIGFEEQSVVRPLRWYELFLPWRWSRTARTIEPPKHTCGGVALVPGVFVWRTEEEARLYEAGLRLHQAREAACPACQWEAR